MNVKLNDTVVVITGKDKGKTGKVVSTSPKTGRVTVQGVNIQRDRRKEGRITLQQNAAQSRRRAQALKCAK